MEARARTPLVAPLAPAGVRVETAVRGEDQPEALRARLSAETLDLLRDAVLLVDATGEVLAANHRARTLLTQADGLALGAGRLEACDAAESQRLGRGVSRATGPARRASTLRVTRRSGGSALRVTLMPLADRAVAAVFVTDPTTMEKPDPARLMALYGLTRSEAKVAARMASGARLQDVARALGITTETVRGHLKRVFGKTGSHRQAELVHLLLTGPASLGR